MARPKHLRVTILLCGRPVWAPMCSRVPSFAETTFDRDAVTCKRCLRMMAKDEREAGV